MFDRPTLLVSCCLAFSGLACCGCQQEMANQRRVESMERKIRPKPAHVIPVATTEDKADSVPLSAESLAQRSPAELTSLLNRGRERYQIHCSPCHGLAGNGDGMVARRGLAYPPSYHSDRLRSKPIKYFFEVATQGIKKMPSYEQYVSVDDRWAIAAYVRALQLSQHAPVDALSAQDKEALKP